MRYTDTALLAIVIIVLLMLTIIVSAVALGVGAIGGAAGKSRAPMSQQVYQESFYQSPMGGYPPPQPGYPQQPQGGYPGYPPQQPPQQPGYPPQPGQYPPNLAATHHSSRVSRRKRSPSPRASGSSLNQGRCDVARTYIHRLAGMLYWPRAMIHY